jgi:hypothetical protein
VRAWNRLTRRFNSCDVSAVPVAIHERITVALKDGKVTMGERWRQLEIAVSSKMLMRSIDTRVHNSPHDAATGGPEDLACDISHYRGYRPMAHRTSLQVRPRQGEEIGNDHRLPSASLESETTSPVTLLVDHDRSPRSLHAAVDPIDPDT